MRRAPPGGLTLERPKSSTTAPSDRGEVRDRRGSTRTTDVLEAFEVRGLVLARNVGPIDRRPFAGIATRIEQSTSNVAIVGAIGSSSREAILETDGPAEVLRRRRAGGSSRRGGLAAHELDGATQHVLRRRGSTSGIHRVGRRLPPARGEPLGSLRAAREHGGQPRRVEDVGHRVDDAPRSSAPTSTPARRTAMCSGPCDVDDRVVRPVRAGAATAPRSAPAAAMTTPIPPAPSGLDLAGTGRPGYTLCFWAGPAAWGKRTGGSFSRGAQRSGRRKGRRISAPSFRGYRDGHLRPWPSPTARPWVDIDVAAGDALVDRIARLSSPDPDPRGDRGRGRVRRALRAPGRAGRAGAGERDRRGRHEAQGGLRRRGARHGGDRPRGHVRERRDHGRGKAALLPRLLRHRASSTSTWARR